MQTSCKLLFIRQKKLYRDLQKDLKGLNQQSAPHVYNRVYNEIYNHALTKLLFK